MYTSRRNFAPIDELRPEEIRFHTGTDRQNKTTISMTYGASCTDVAFLTPAAVTNWPRVTGDGNFGTMWGPQDITKAKFSLDLTDTPINGVKNECFVQLQLKLEAIDDKLLDFVHQNQLSILGRKNLSREELRVLQIRSVRPKYDKHSGTLVGHSMQMSAPKYVFDGMGSKTPRSINICDNKGVVIQGADVAPGDVVAATAFANQVYVIGDKFGIHWSFEEISVVCQRMHLEVKTEVPVFGSVNYDFAKDYVFASAGVKRQFSD